VTLYSLSCFRELLNDLNVDKNNPKYKTVLYLKWAFQFMKEGQRNNLKWAVQNLKEAVSQDNFGKGEFDHNKQEDAKDFLLKLLRDIEDIDKDTEAKVKEMFNFEMKQVTAAKGWGTSTTTNETMRELHVRYPKDRKGKGYLFNYCRISEVISTTLESSQIQTDNGQEFIESTFLQRPRILLISFNKTDIQNRTDSIQIQTEIEIKVEEKSSWGSLYYEYSKYELKSIIQHFGTHNAGHYKM